MTRDEAIKLARETFAKAGGSTVDVNFRASIDTYIALGILKVEREQTPHEKAVKIIDDRLAALNSGDPSPANGWDIVLWLSKAGLKITEG